MPLRTKLDPSSIAKLLNAIKTPRQRECEILQAYYDGTMYDGRPSYFDRQSQLPRLERAPCVRYPLAKAAIDSNVALSMGGARFPRVLSMSSEDDSDFDPQYGLSPEDSATLDQFNAKAMQVAGLDQQFRQAYRVAQAARSAGLVLSYRNGLPAIDVLWPKICAPTFDAANPDSVVSLEIRYRYVDQFSDPVTTGGDWWPVVKEYRRVIDAKNDTVYQVKEIWNITDTTPTAVVQSRVAHGFGFCPVRWYARQRSSFAVGGYDGVAVHDGRLTEIDAINHALSSRHLAAMYAGDPIMVGIGVDSSDDMGASGRLATPESLDPMGSRRSVENQVWGFGGALGGSAIRKEPGQLYRLSGEGADLKYVSLQADALDAISDHTADLCSKTREALRYVWIDPEKLTGSGDVSGKTLAFVFSSQVNAINDDRADFWRACLLPTLGLIYRMLAARSDGVFLPGIAKALPILQRFLVKLADGSVSFMAPQLMPRWGDMFEPSDVDESTRVATSVQALQAGIITTQVAVEHVKDVFAISAVDQHVEALADEKAQKQADAVANAQAMAKVGALGPAAPHGGTGAPAGGAKAAPNAAKPAKAKQSRTRSA